MKIADKTKKTLVVDILSSSFDDNTSINFIVKQDRRRKERIRYLMSYCFDVCLQKGNIFLSDDEKGCILILKPELKTRILTRLILHLKLVFSCIGIVHLPRVIERENKLKKYHPKKNHYYLWLFGVYPDYQNIGIGSQLFANALKMCDQEKRPLFLETSVIRNLPLYERSGFKKIATIDVGYPMFLMIRE